MTDRAVAIAVLQVPGGRAWWVVLTEHDDEDEVRLPPYRERAHADVAANTLAIAYRLDGYAVTQEGVPDGQGGPGDTPEPAGD